MSIYSYPISASSGHPNLQYSFRWSLPGALPETSYLSIKSPANHPSKERRFCVVVLNYAEAHGKPHSKDLGAPNWQSMG